MQTHDADVVRAFESWLQERKYAPSTIAVSVDAARSILAGGQDRWLVATAKRLQHLYPTGPVGEACARVLTHDRTRRHDNAFRGRVGVGKLKIGALVATSWEALVADVSDPASEEPTYHVLALMCATGLRIGDVLRITRAQLDKGRRTGEYTLKLKGDKPVLYPHAVAPVAWEKLHAGLTADKAANVAIYVAPRGDGSPLPAHAAYQAVNRQLKACCGRLGIEERMFLHRIRKTVADQLYSGSHDLVAVRDAMGHEDVRTTQRYVNAYSPSRVLEAHEARKKFQVK